MDGYFFKAELSLKEEHYLLEQHKLIEIFCIETMVSPRENFFHLFENSLLIASLWVQSSEKSSIMQDTFPGYYPEFLSNISEIKHLKEVSIAFRPSLNEVFNDFNLHMRRQFRKLRWDYLVDLWFEHLGRLQIIERCEHGPYNCCLLRLSQLIVPLSCREHFFDMGNCPLVELESEVLDVWYNSLNALLYLPQGFHLLRQFRFIHYFFL